MHKLLESDVLTRIGIPSDYFFLCLAECIRKKVTNAQHKNMLLLSKFFCYV